MKPKDIDKMLQRIADERTPEELADLRNDLKRARKRFRWAQSVCNIGQELAAMRDIQEIEDTIEAAEAAKRQRPTTDP